jgi:hypothetical protein
VSNEATEEKADTSLTFSTAYRSMNTRQKTHNSLNWKGTPLLFQPSTQILTMLFWKARWRAPILLFIVPAFPEESC